MSFRVKMWHWAGRNEGRRGTRCGYGKKGFEGRTKRGLGYLEMVPRYQAPSENITSTAAPT
eukprot:2918241-Rhodomonas_salina.1